jgi:hypothetical protein
MDFRSFWSWIWEGILCAIQKTMHFSKSRLKVGEKKIE